MISCSLCLFFSWILSCSCCSCDSSLLFDIFVLSCSDFSRSNSCLSWSNYKRQIIFVISFTCRINKISVNKGKLVVQNLQQMGEFECVGFSSSYLCWQYIVIVHVQCTLVILLLFKSATLTYHHQI
jgi:hypothetical protein